MPRLIGAAYRALQDDGTWVGYIAGADGVYRPVPEEKNTEEAED